MHPPLASLDVVIDVEGYIAPATNSSGLFNPLPPNRIVDTRSNAPSGLQDTNHFVSANSTIPVQATGFGGIPTTGVEAVAVNITVTDTIGSGFLVAYPSNSTSSSSTLNFGPGQSVPNRAIVDLSPTGQFTIEVARAGADVIVDVNGWYTNTTSSSGYEFHPLSPVRVADSRAPYIKFSPVRQWKDSEMFTRAFSCIKEVPQFWTLSPRIPLAK